MSAPETRSQRTERLRRARRNAVLDGDIIHMKQISQVASYTAIALAVVGLALGLAGY